MKISKILILIFIFKINTIFGSPTITDKIIALVNNNTILDSDIKNNTYFDLNQNPNTTVQYQQILEQLITDELILQIIMQNNLNIDHNTIIHDTTISVAKLFGMTLNQFYIYLHKIGLSHNKYYLQQRQNILKNTICDDIISNTINATVDDIKTIAKKINFIDFNKQFKLTHIILSLPIQPTQNQINTIEHFAKLFIKERKQNNNIKKLLDTYSNKNILNIIKVHTTEWISWKDIPIIFDKYLKTAHKGDIIGPILSYDGIHILEIIDIRNKALMFPIVKIKAKIFGIKHTQENATIIQQLLQIKEYVGNNNTIFKMIIQKKLQDTYFNYYEEDIIWQDLNKIEPTIRNILLSLDKNEISTPIRTDRGWSIIQLVDTSVLDYNEAIYERAYLYLLHNKYNEIIKNWIQELKKTSYIKLINDNN